MDLGAGFPPRFLEPVNESPVKINALFSGKGERN